MQLMLSKHKKITIPHNLGLQESPEQNSPQEYFLSSFTLHKFGTGKSQDDALTSPQKNERALSKHVISTYAKIYERLYKSLPKPSWICWKLLFWS